MELPKLFRPCTRCNGEASCDFQARNLLQLNRYHWLGVWECVKQGGDFSGSEAGGTGVQSTVESRYPRTMPVMPAKVPRWKGLKDFLQFWGTLWHAKAACLKSCLIASGQFRHLAVGLHGSVLHDTLFLSATLQHTLEKASSLKSPARSSSSVGSVLHSQKRPSVDNVTGRNAATCPDVEELPALGQHPARSSSLSVISCPASSAEQPFQPKTAKATSADTSGAAVSSAAK